VLGGGLHSGPVQYTSSKHKRAAESNASQLSGTEKSHKHYTPHLLSGF